MRELFPLPLSRHLELDMALQGFRTSGAVARLFTNSTSAAAVQSRNA